jgi:hypothetical protein
MENSRQIDTSTRREREIAFSTICCIICTVAGLGVSFFGWWPTEYIYWQMGGIFMMVLALTIGLFRKNLSGELCLRLGGGACLLWGLAFVFNFHDVFRSGPWLALFSLSLAGMGGYTMILGRKILNQRMLLATLVLLTGSGAVGVIDRIYGWMETGVVGVYDPDRAGKGVFFVTDPCFLVLGHDGVIQVLPSGHGGVFPSAPSPDQVGKNVGPYKIIGVVEKGAEIHILSEGGGSIAVLDFSLVSPNPAFGRFAVVKPPI